MPQRKRPRQALPLSMWPCARMLSGPGQLVSAPGHSQHHQHRGRPDMRPLARSAIFGFVAVVGAMALAVASGSDPVVGTWQLDAAKSTFTNSPAVKSQTRTYTQSGPSITVVIKSVGADGKI